VDRFSSHGPPGPGSPSVRMTASWTGCSGVRKSIPPCAISTFIAHGRGKARRKFSGFVRDLGAQGMRAELPEETLLSCGSGGSGRLWPRGLLPASAEGGIEGLGHDVRGARAAVSAGVGRAVALSALCVGHVLGPRGKSESLTLPYPSLHRQGATVINSASGGSGGCQYSSHRLTFTVGVAATFQRFERRLEFSWVTLQELVGSLS
jgi:hypothetical protein